MDSPVSHLGHMAPWPDPARDSHWRFRGSVPCLPTRAPRGELASLTGTGLSTPARRSPCSGSSCTAWLGPSHGFTSAPRTPRPLPALPTPPLPDRPIAQARGGRAVRWDAQSRLRKEGRAPSDRWRGAKTLLLLAVSGVAETRRPTSGGMGCLCYCPFVHS